MFNSKPIILIEDDEDDIYIFKQAIETSSIRTRIIIFNSGEAAYQHLLTTNTPPGIIICDMQLSGEHGVDLRRRLAENERIHNLTIPFVFLTTSLNAKYIGMAYQLPVQGVFIKPNSIEEYVKLLETISAYWSQSKTPADAQLIPGA